MMQRNFKFFYLLFIFIFTSITTTAFADPLPTNAPYPGGIAIVPLAIQNKFEPRVFYDNKRILVKFHDGEWNAIVGLDLNTTPGLKKLIINPPLLDHPTHYYFLVKPKIYPLRHITIKDKSKVTPDPKLARQIQAESIAMRRIFNEWQYVPNVQTTFTLPVEGPLSSRFGLRRIYNKVKHGRHTGTDIAATTGTPIKAAAAGKVAKVYHFVLTGNTVFINHGQGLITYYCHMSHVDVKPGQFVKQGELLGTVGATGRVTGPHLHWGAVLNGAQVNPLLFLHKNS